MHERTVRKRNIFNPFLRTYMLELRLRWKKILLFSIVVVGFTFLISFSYPYHFDANTFLRDEIGYFKYLIVFISCFFFSDIVCSEFSLKTGYIMFPKINKYKLIAGKYNANLSIIILLVIVHYVTLNISVLIIYDTVIPELFISLGFAVMYTITLSAIILLFSTIIPKINLTTIIVIILFLIGFYIVEQVTTIINQEIEPILSLNYIGNLIIYVIPGGLSNGERWFWVYYAGETLPPIKLWRTPTIEMGILIMSLYIALSFLFTFLALKRKEF
ncbi:MAG: hypothetical protein MUP85_03720 [Candidatus Lokiarchaeota archaeon]|nr:hypothetical protein [Candidatus Lokiarchaeota archaeon]